jgi:hypothetical protein
MAPTCSDCETDLVSAEPVTAYDESTLKVRIDEPHEGRLGRLLGMNQTAKVDGWLCLDCRRVFLYAADP